MFGFGCVITAIIVFLVSLFEAWVLMLLWNWLMPMIFALPEVTIWQMYGLMILINIVVELFKRK